MARKKSPWNALTVIVFIALIIGWVIFLSRISNQIDWFKGEMILPLMIPVFGVSILMTNVLMYLIPPARKVFKLQTGGDPEMLFKPVMKRQFYLTVVVLLPVGLIWSIIIGVYVNA